MQIVHRPYHNFASDYFSIVMQALVDADYKFTVVDIGSYGSIRDNGIFAESSLGRGLQNGTLNVSEAEALALQWRS